MADMIPFIDLKAQRARLKEGMDAAVSKVLDEGRYILGPEVTELETKLAEFNGEGRALACANGTDAILIPLMAWGIGPGDAVFVPSFTFAASAEVVVLAGASPVFVDVDPDTYNISLDSLSAAIEAVKAAGELTPRAIIAVDLFGQPADYPKLREIADAKVQEKRTAAKKRRLEILREKMANKEFAELQDEELFDENDYPIPFEQRKSERDEVAKLLEDMSVDV